jgi:hypothetical protein
VADAVFVPDVGGWSHAFKSRGGLVGQYIAQVTDDVAYAVQIAAPGPGKMPFNRTGRWYGTGATQKSINSSVSADGIGEVEGTVSAGTKQVVFIIHGTRPHVIRPKKPGGMLKFYWWRKGRVVHFRRVHHPGTVENNFMLRGLKIGFRVGV